MPPATGGSGRSPAKAPSNKATKPNVDPPPSRHHRDRPRSNNDPRVTASGQNIPDGKRESYGALADDLNAMKVEREAHAAARSKGSTEKTPAGRALGEKGADRYMENRFGAKKVYEGQSANGNFDLDRVYEKDGILHVVEAKGPSGKPWSREVPGKTISDGRPAHAMQESREYLEMTIDSMLKSGNPASVAMAQRLQTALTQGKVRYWEVATRYRSNKTMYFSVQKWKIGN